MRQRLLSGILIDLQQLAGIHLLQLPLQLTLVLLQLLHGQQVGIHRKQQTSLQILPGQQPGILVTVLAKAPAKALIHPGLLARALHKALLLHGLPLGLHRGPLVSLPLLRLLLPSALANQLAEQPLNQQLPLGQLRGLLPKPLLQAGPLRKLLASQL